MRCASLDYDTVGTRKDPRRATGDGETPEVTTTTINTMKQLQRYDLEPDEIDNTFREDLKTKVAKIGHFGLLVGVYVIHKLRFSFS